MERDLSAAILEVAREIDTPPRAIKRDAFAAHPQGWKPDRGYTEAREQAQRRWEAGDGATLGKVTVQSGPTGEVERTWSRSRPDESDIRAAAWLMERVGRVPALPLTEPLLPPPAAAADLCAVVLMGDTHIGKYCSELIGGERWDRARALDVSRQAIDHLVMTGQPAAHGVLADVGDYLHAANLLGQTVKGTPLDVDGIFHEALLDGHDLKVYAIRRMLQYHDHVTVISKAGNHEGVAQYHMALGLMREFRAEPRVTVEVNAEVLSLFTWGKCLIPVTHGDTIKGKEIGRALLADRRYRKTLSEAEHIHAFVGHWHHLDRAKDDYGVIYEYVPTLPPADRWHHDHGFFGCERSMNRVVFHRDGRELSRSKFTA